MPFDESTRHRGYGLANGGSKPSEFWRQNDALLKQLALDGKTTAEAAVELGVSKNAVIGRGQRVGAQWRIKPTGGRKKKPEPVTAPADVIAPPGEWWRKPAIKGLAIEFPPPNGCRFPHGHPGEPGFRFCGDQVVRPGLPYCSSHMAVCYAAHKPKQEAA